MVGSRQMLYLFIQGIDLCLKASGEMCPSFGLSIVAMPHGDQGVDW